MHPKLDYLYKFSSYILRSSTQFGNNLANPNFVPGNNINRWVVVLTGGWPTILFQKFIIFLMKKLNMKVWKISFLTWLYF